MGRSRYAFFLRRFFAAFFVPFFAAFLAALRFLAMDITSFLDEIVHHDCVLSKEILSMSDVNRRGATRASAIAFSDSRLMSNVQQSAAR
jgi:hypothetical protein